MRRLIATALGRQQSWVWIVDWGGLAAVVGNISSFKTLKTP